MAVPHTHGISLHSTHTWQGVTTDLAYCHGVHTQTQRKHHDAPQDKLMTANLMKEGVKVYSKHPHLALRWEALCLALHRSQQTILQMQTWLKCLTSAVWHTCVDVGGAFLDAAGIRSRVWPVMLVFHSPQYGSTVEASALAPRALCKGRAAESALADD